MASCNSRFPRCRRHFYRLLIRRLPLNRALCTIAENSRITSKRRRLEGSHPGLFADYLLADAEGERDQGEDIANVENFIDLEDACIISLLTLPSDIIQPNGKLCFSCNSPGASHNPGISLPHASAPLTTCTRSRYTHSGRTRRK